MTIEQIWRELLRNVVPLGQPRWYADGSVRVMTQAFPLSHMEQQGGLRDALAAALEDERIDVALVRDSRDVWLAFGDEVRLVVRDGGHLAREAAIVSLERG
jgi:hypothetical protein